MTGGSGKETDWAGSYRAFALAWGIPVAALAAAIFIPTPAKTIVWMAALVWMGVACLANASRCGRLHCFYTGPFFLVMAAIAGLHGFGIVPLGPQGWRWLGIALGVGSGLLWCIPEHLIPEHQRANSLFGVEPTAKSGDETSRKPRAGFAALIAAKVVCCGGLILASTGALAGIGAWFVDDGGLWIVGGGAAALIFCGLRFLRLRRQSPAVHERMPQQATG